MKISILLFVSLLFATTSCAQDEYVVDDNFTYHVSIDTLYEELKFDDVFEEYRCIALKQSPDYLICEIKQLFQYKDRIIVVTDGIYCFDFDGNPVYNIVNRGHAKNEYLYCASVSLCDSLLYMYDRGKRMTHVYDAYSGKYLYGIESPSVENIYCIGDKMVIEDKLKSTELTRSNSRFFVYDKSFTRLQYRVFGKEQYLYNIGYPVSIGNKSILFSDYYECRLYKMLSDRVVSYLQIDCDTRYRNTPDQIGQSIRKARSQNDNLHALQHVCETKTHIFGTFIFKRKDYEFVLDKRSGHSKVCIRILGEGYQHWHSNSSDRRFANDTYLCRYYGPERIYRPQNKYAYGEQLSINHPEYRNQKILQDCRPDDNPIVILYRFRSF